MMSLSVHRLSGVPCQPPFGTAAICHEPEGSSTSAVTCQAPSFSATVVSTWLGPVSVPVLKPLHWSTTVIGDRAVDLPAAQPVIAAFRSTTRWGHSAQALAANGARVQRPLWASTSTKNPAYRDVMYVEALIGPDTVDTMPPQTIDAFRDHGIVARTVDADLDRERRAIADLESLGISLASVTDKLLVDGLASFQKSFEGLLERLEQKVVG